MSKDFVALRQELKNTLASVKSELGPQLSGFMSLHHAALKEGALSAKVKELMALGMSITARCDGCIAAHVEAAVKAGASKAEVIETVGVAMLMAGGPATVYGAQAIDAFEQFKARA